MRTRGTERSRDEENDFGWKSSDTGHSHSDGDKHNEDNGPCAAKGLVGTHVRQHVLQHVLQAEEGAPGPPSGLAAGGLPGGPVQGAPRAGQAAPRCRSDSGSPVAARGFAPAPGGDEQLAELSRTWRRRRRGRRRSGSPGAQGDADLEAGPAAAPLGAAVGLRGARSAERLPEPFG